jgi:hypothetical protein
VTEDVSLAGENINNGFVTISRVPEPSTWVMTLLGLAGLGFMGYRRRKKTGPRGPRAAMSLWCRRALHSFGFEG